MSKTIDLQALYGGGKLKPEDEWIDARHNKLYFVGIDKFHGEAKWIFSNAHGFLIYFEDGSSPAIGACSLWKPANSLRKIKYDFIQIFCQCEDKSRAYPGNGTSTPIGKVRFQGEFTEGEGLNDE